MQSRFEQVGWDYLLIDESQDWGELEKELVFKIFGKNKIVIADGVDQLIRSQSKCSWTRALKPTVDFRKTSEKKGLRQKVNLVNFVNNLADKLNVRWNLEPKPELIGGKIVITSKEYDQSLHNREYQNCVKNGNSAYEMMFLVPPSLVESYERTNDYNKTVKDRRFKNLNKYENQGIKLWDGTSAELRTEYVVDLDSHRLLQYESCRGLEGWTVVNLNFDDFIKYKMDTYKKEETNELALESFDETRNRFVYLWALIPMTRAIDTLVITLSQSESKIKSALREIYESNPDYIEWIE